MREFLAEVNGLTVDDFDIPPGGYTNVIVLNGYNHYISTYTKDAVIAEDGQDFDIRKKSVESWLELSLIEKIKWVIKGYGVQKDAEWGRKQFVDSIDLFIYTVTKLHKFIDDYLERNVLYTKFIDHWKAQQGDKVVREEIKEEIIREKESIITGQHLAVTEEEQGRINDMKERLSGYEAAFKKLQEKILIKEEFLSEQSHDELVDLATPIIGKKN